MGCVCVVMLGLGVGGGRDCRGAAYRTPTRTVWPTLTGYPGAEVIDAPSVIAATPVAVGETSPATVQSLVFTTEASRGHVEQYYLDTWRSQGWQRGASGSVVELTHCPTLWLDVTPITATEGRTTYRLTLRQERCSDDYC